jgi:hypothetical protein
MVKRLIDYLVQFKFFLARIFSHSGPLLSFILFFHYLGKQSELIAGNNRPTEVHEPLHQDSYRKLHSECDIELVLIATGEPFPLELSQSVVYSRS